MDVGTFSRYGTDSQFMLLGRPSPSRPRAGVRSTVLTHVSKLAFPPDGAAA